MKKHYLITYQQRSHGRSEWQIANDTTDKDPGVWLAEVCESHEETAVTVLLSAVEITAAGFKAASKVI